MSENLISNVLNNKQKITLQEKIKIIISLSIPAILAQISETVMQYIDTAMVGSLGANASASIGLVSTTTWLIGGLINACSMGFSIQVAHLVGAKNYQRSKDILRQGLVICLSFSLFLTIFSIGLSFILPDLLGAQESLKQDATYYFLFFALFLLARTINNLCGSMLQCSGNIKIPSILNIIMCLSDVVFNFLLIYPTRSITLFGISFTIYGANLKVLGASLGTSLAVCVSAIFMFYFCCIKSDILNIKDKGSYKIEKQVMINWSNIALPMALESSILNIAQIIATKIITPLQTVAIAANSIGVTAESLCYLPGYGIGSAATTLVGQSIGAKRKDLAKSFAFLSTIIVMFVMGILGLVMYINADLIFQIMSNDIAVQQLGASVLRIELLVEPLFGASICSCACLRGANDTKTPALINLISMWCIRLVLAYILTYKFNYGLKGVWIAMAIDLSFRGIILLLRLINGKWLNNYKGE